MQLPQFHAKAPRSVYQPRYPHSALYYGEPPFGGRLLASAVPRTFPVGHRPANLLRIGEEPHASDGRSTARSDSSDEYFEANATFSGGPSMSIGSAGIHSLIDSGITVFSADLVDGMDEVAVPLMQCPLAPINTPLDFSVLEAQRGLTNIYSATPLARVWEFNTKPQQEECTILNILADEFESRRLQSREAEPSFWATLKHFTVGTSPDEFDRMYPWAKYSIRRTEED